MVLIDNAAYSFGHFVGNGIPILSFFDDWNDKELLYLTSYLESIHNVENFKQANAEAFQLENLSKKELQDYINLYTENPKL